MPRIDWRAALRALLGFLIGLAIWATLSPLYTRLVVRAAEISIRTFERPAVTKLRADGNYCIIDRADFDPRSKSRPTTPVNDLTFNFILLIALFAFGQRPFSDRNVVGFLIATVVLHLTHVFGMVTEVMSVYTQKLGGWSIANYSSFERGFWSVSNHFYRLVLMYAIAFALWWIFRGPDTAPAKATRKKR